MPDTSYSAELPEPIPDGKITVENEQHEYIAREKDFDEYVEQTEYILDKAPIEKIETVTGTTDDGYVTFNKGTDYQLSDDNERIVWDTNYRTPEPGTQFYVTYTTPSVISRFAEASSEEIDEIDHAIDNIIDGKLVDKAEGDELDRIGGLFGVLGQRQGRDDVQYRIYLKSIVQSFASRGTINDIKTAISAATDVPIEDITIEEDFENNEYTVNIIAATPITGSLLEEVAEIADPSGVNQRRTTFKIPADETGINEIIDISEGQQISDELVVDDAAVWNRTDFTDIVALDDSFAIDPNHYDAGTDTLYADDSPAIDENHYDAGTDTLYLDDDAVGTPSSAAFEDIEIGDVVQNIESSEKNTYRWEDNDDPSETTWDFFEWTEIIDLTSTASDTAYSDDAVTIPPKDAATTDTGGSNDTITSSQTLVAWDTNDWNTLEWVQEHN